MEVYHMKFAAEYSQSNQRRVNKYYKHMVYLPSSFLKQTIYFFRFDSLFLQMFSLRLKWYLLLLV